MATWRVSSLLSVAQNTRRYSETGLTSFQQFVHTHYYALLSSCWRLDLNNIGENLVVTIQLMIVHFFNSMIIRFQRIPKALAWCSTQWSYSLVISVQMLCQGGFVTFWDQIDFYQVFRAGLSYAGGKIPQTTQNVINGQWVESSTDRWIDVHNPATNQVGKTLLKVDFCSSSLISARL